MNDEQAKTYIEKLKEMWYSGSHMFCHPSVKWCQNHEPLVDKLGLYKAWPVLMDNRGVVCYMNEYGYGMNGDGDPCHPLADMLGLQMD